jgi:hypothetical protein
MTLQVPYDQFAETVRRVLAVKEVYVTCQGSQSLITACSASSQTIVAALSATPRDRAKKELSDQGLKVFDGAWSAEGLTDLGVATPAEAHVAAVAYLSNEGRPGLWIDAYDSAPTPAQVLKTMYEEFRGTGETADVSFEEFVRLANANVVLVNPSQIRAFVQEKAAKVLPD